MGAPPKCRLLPSVRAARASSDPVAHRAPRPRPRPAACAWCEEPPERGLPHCDDRTTCTLCRGQPVDGAVCAQARLHAQCARRLCQCTRNARAVHAHFTRNADALSTKPHTSGVTRRPCAWHTTHPAPPPTPPMPAHAASPGPRRRSPGAAGLARATRLRSGARRGRICPLPRRRSPRRGRRSRHRRRGSRPRRPRRPSHSSPTRRARCSRANPKPHPHTHPHPWPKGAAHVLARGRTCTPQTTARGRPS